MPWFQRQQAETNDRYLCDSAFERRPLGPTDGVGPWAALRAAASHRPTIAWAFGVVASAALLALCYLWCRLDKRPESYDPPVFELNVAAQGRHRMAMRYHRSGDYGAALRILERAIEVDADSYRLHGDIARVLMEIARFKELLSPLDVPGEVDRLHIEALSHLDKALRVAPDDADLCYQRGRVYHSLGRDDEAEAEWRRALELRPLFALAGNELSALWIDQGRHLDEAIGTLERARATLHPSDGQIYATVLMNLGRAYGQNGQLDQAWAVLDAAECIGPIDRPDVKAKILSHAAPVHASLLGPATAAVTWRRFGRLVDVADGDSLRRFMLWKSTDESARLGIGGREHFEPWSRRCLERQSMRATIGGS